MEVVGQQQKTVLKKSIRHGANPTRMNEADEPDAEEQKSPPGPKSGQRLMKLGQTPAQVMENL